MKRNLLIIAALALNSVFAQQPSSFNFAVKQDDTSNKGVSSQIYLEDFQLNLSSSFDDQYQSFDGFAFSNMKDTSTFDYTNDLTSATASGVYNSRGYLVAYQGVKTPTFIPKQSDVQLTGTFVNNTFYSYKCLLLGDPFGFSKAFGGQTGDDADWFKAEFIGYNDDNVTETIEFYLADYRNQDNSKDYIVKDWTWVDLSSLGKVDSVQVVLSSSDTGQYGMNNPAYIAFDDFNGVTPGSSIGVSDFEDFTLADIDTFDMGYSKSEYFLSQNTIFENYFSEESWGDYASQFVLSNTTSIDDKTFMNQYAVKNGIGYENSENYLVANQSSFSNLYPTINLPLKKEGHSVSGFYINNTEYAYDVIKNGNQFSSKFGGASGDVQDYFLLNIIGYDYSGKVVDTVKFYLADYRFADNSMDYIIEDWTWVDLSSLNNIVSIQFKLESSDSGQSGMNTPAYFALDNFNDEAPLSVEELASNNRINLYPNPTSGNIFLDKTFEVVEIYTTSGVKMQEAVNTNTLDLNKLPNGLYFINAYLNNSKYTSRVEVLK